MYCFLRCENKNTTIVSVSSLAKSLLSILCFLLEPLGSPHIAKQIQSKIVVFPAPVSPEIKKIPSLNLVKSNTVSSANGPNADNINFCGLNESPPQKWILPSVLFFHPDQYDFAFYKTVQIIPLDFDLRSGFLSSEWFHIAS